MEGGGNATRITESGYLKRVIARGVVTVGALLALLALPSVVGTTAWFARVVAGMLPASPGPVRTGSANVYQSQGQLTFIPNSAVSNPVGAVDWTLSYSVTGLTFRPLRQVITLSYVPKASPAVTTAQIDELVGRTGMPVWGMHPHLAEPEPELIVRSPDGLAGLDNFGVLQVRPRQKTVLYPLRTLGTLGNLHPWMLWSYYAVVAAYGVAALFSIRTVRALRRREKGQCVRCAYPRGGTCECSECGLVYPRPVD